MFRRSEVLPISTVRVLLLLAIFAVQAHAYRPFLSTDAGVTKSGDAEFEIGYFGISLAKDDITFLIPTAVINFGFLDRFEIVGQFNLEKPIHEGFQINDAALSLKGVLKDGFLQEKEGISVAFEADLLFPSTLPDRSRFGAQGTGIISAKIDPMIFHFNLGGGIENSRSNFFILWGVISEFPIDANWRLVNEFVGRHIIDGINDVSALLGCIWQTPWKALTLDTGVRRGLTPDSADWQFQLGFTIGFHVL